MKHITGKTSQTTYRSSDGVCEVPDSNTDTTLKIVCTVRRVSSESRMMCSSLLTKPISCINLKMFF